MSFSPFHERNSWADMVYVSHSPFWILFTISGYFSHDFSVLLLLTASTWDSLHRAALRQLEHYAHTWELAVSQ